MPPSVWVPSVKPLVTDLSPMPLLAATGWVAGLSEAAFAARACFAAALSAAVVVAVSVALRAVLSTDLPVLGTGAVRGIAVAVLATALKAAVTAAEIGSFVAAGGNNDFGPAAAA